MGPGPGPGVTLPGRLTGDGRACRWARDRLTQGRSQASRAVGARMWFDPA